MQRKIIYAIAVMLVLALGIAWIILSDASPADIYPPEASDDEPATGNDDIQDLRDIKTSPQVPSRESIQKRDTPQTNNVNEEPGTFPVTLSVGDEFYSANILENSNVIDAMEKIALESGLEFETKNYPGLGEFVESINGVRNGSGNYWFLYVNGNSSSVGASQYILSSGDAIEWRFQEQN
jgi:hypothetical protein